jgi:CubicO group peptidase (beta-lactamase class C family)
MFFRTSLVALLILPSIVDADDRVAAAGQFIDRYATYGLSGAFIVVQDEKVLLHTAVGVADRDGNIENGVDTYFDIGSITKTLTGAAILRLEADGKLDTSLTLDTYLGPFPADKASATVHHLATHKAGLVVRGADVTSRSRDRFVANVKRAMRESAPGAEYRYTNAGYSLLAAVIESASGQSYESYVREFLLEPGGADAIRFVSEIDPDTMAIAQGYGGTHGKRTVDPIEPALWGDRGAGSSYGRVMDVYLWVVAIRDWTVLPRELESKLFDATETEAYGWHDQLIGGRRLIHKGGQTRWFASQVLYYPDEDLIIVWALNDNRQRWRTLLNRGLSAIFLGDDIELPVPVEADAEALARITGLYRTSNGESVRFRIASDSHGMYVDGDTVCLPGDVLVFPAGENRFFGFDGRDGAPVMIQTDSEGRAMKSVWRGESLVRCGFSSRQAAQSR